MSSNSNHSIPWAVFIPKHAATTGSGMSFFTNEMVQEALSKGGRARLDIGSTYKSIIPDDQKPTAKGATDDK